MTEASNRKELEEALAYYDENVGDLNLLAVAAAARAHLATLPKPDKTITVWAVDWVFRARNAFSSIVMWVPQCTICLTKAEAEQWVRDNERNDQIRNILIREIERTIPDDD